MVRLAQELRNAVLQAAVTGRFSKGDNIYKTIKTKYETTQIPEDWTECTLSEIIIDGPTNGISVKGTERETSIKNLTLTATTSGEFKPQEFKYVELELESTSKYWLKTGDILIQRSNSPELVGTSCVYTGNDNEFIYPDLMMKIKINKNLVDLWYMDCMLKSPIVRDYYRKSASGTSSSMPKINQTTVKNTPVFFPCIEEQKRIVAVVNELMARIDEFETIENDLEELKTAFPGEMKEALLQAAMEGKLTERLKTDDSIDVTVSEIEKACGRVISGVYDHNMDIPDGWAVLKLSDVSDFYTGNSISKTEKKQKYEGVESGFDYVATKDVGFDHEIAYNNGVRIPFDNKDFKYAYEHATLLCIEGGSAGRKIGILDRQVCFGNKLCAFHPKGINHRFLYYYLQSPVFRAFFKENLAGIIGGVSIKKLRNILFPTPTTKEQQRIVDRLDKLLPFCDELENLK